MSGGGGNNIFGPADSVKFALICWKGLLIYLARFI